MGNYAQTSVLFSHPLENYNILPHLNEMLKYIDYLMMYSELMCQKSIDPILF